MLHAKAPDVQATVGTIIDSRPDGSFIYMSHLGILNLDDSLELSAAQADDLQFVSTHEFGLTSRCAQY